MKKIICFTESLAGGGAEHQIALLSSLLAEEGYEVSLVTYADIPDHYEVPANVKRIRVGEGKGSLIKLISLLKFFLRVDVDCIISYRKMCNIRLLIPMFFRSHKVKVICSERNTTTTKPDAARRFMVHVLYRRADYIVSNSNTQTNYICLENPVLRPKLRTIHNYTDLDHFKASPLPSDTDILKFAVFARYSRQKNPILFMDALQSLKSRTDRRFEVHWYGNQYSSDGSYNTDFLKVKQYSENLDISDIFHMHPAVKDPSALMSEFHAICLPSLYEGFSNSIAEAICCGKPMLVGKVSDNTTMVREGINGFLFDPTDIKSICDAFLKFFNLDFGQMRAMAECSRNIALELFDREFFIGQYKELIES